MRREPFGTMPDGKVVERITLDSGKARCSIVTYGGALATLEVPDRDGKRTDIVLGFNTLEDYRRQDKYIGALIGRYGNRIGGSRFALNGTEYPLYANEGRNHLHGGKEGFDKKLWAAAEIPDGVRLTLVSPHMEEGFPGTLKVEVDYKLVESTLTIQYRATSDADTVCNLTNHAYFNLGGQGSGSILDHTLRLFAQRYTAVDRESISTGALPVVTGTPMDFRVPVEIGARIDDDYEQLRFTSGYDHNWVLDGGTSVLHPAAEVHCPRTGITMRVDTTLPGVQFYAGNYLDGCPAGKGGARFGKRDGFCLETQFYPDSMANPDFPQPILRAGEIWAHTTVFSLSTESA